MDAQKLHEDIKSNNPFVRLQAARFFSSNPHLVDPEVIRDVLLQETVPWIHTALRRALEQAEVSVAKEKKLEELSTESSGGEVNERIINAIKAKAAEEVTATILHEFSTVIGSISLQALGEFDNFEDSKTSKLLNRLNDLLKAIRNLKAAASSPTYTEFSLSDLVDEILLADSELVEDIQVLTVGPKPFLTTADRGSLLLAIVNGLRNASEAVRSFSTKSPPEIHLNWGGGEGQDFLAIVDTGSGFKDNPADALRIGVTSKSNHIGYGLATAQYAMRAMEGELLVSNSLDGGAKFELRWYKENEDSTG
ncbi:hypothetical protein [Pseudomonas germanica]